MTERLQSHTHTFNRPRSLLSRTELIHSLLFDYKSFDASHFFPLLPFPSPLLIVRAWEMYECPSTKLPSEKWLPLPRLSTDWLIFHCRFWHCKLPGTPFALLKKKKGRKKRMMSLICFFHSTVGHWRCITVTNYVAFLKCHSKVRGTLKTGGGVKR